MASKNTYGGAGIAPMTYPNKPGGGGGKAASYAGKHERAMAHVTKGMSQAATLGKKNRGQ